MNVKIEKTKACPNGEARQVLDIFFNEEGKAYIKGHSPEESEKLIHEFIEGSNDEEKPSEEKIELNNEIVLAGQKENLFGKDDWDGQTFVLNGGILRLKDEIDPTIRINGEALLIYDGYTVGLSDTQKNNIANADPNAMVAFTDCYFNFTLDINNVKVGIDKGAHTTVKYCVGVDVFDRMTERRTISICDGAHIDSLTAGECSHVAINTDMCSGDEAPVTIDNLVINGTGKLDMCEIGHLTVGALADVEIFGKIGHMCVSGTAFIDEQSDVGTVHIHPGGKLHGYLEHINIEADRAFTMYSQDGETWIIG